MAVDYGANIVNDLPSRNEIALIAMHALLSQQSPLSAEETIEQCFMYADTFLTNAQEQENE